MPNKMTTAALALFATLSGAAAVAKAPEPALKLEKVVMLMRHGVRPPTSAQPSPDGYTRDVWPSWPVDFGLLTPHGAQGVTLLGAADRAEFQRRGLFGAGCPKPGTIILKASGKPRAIKTAEAWQAGFAPGCPAATVSHPSGNEPDLIFHGLDDKPASFDGKRAHQEAEKAMPKGGMKAEARLYRSELALLGRALGCLMPACTILDAPTKLVAEPHDRPGLEGPLDEASSISQSFLLEYLDGKPMTDVAWGRASRADIERMLKFHPLKFKYSNRPDYVARAAGAPIAREIAAALKGTGARLTLLAGHDTNIADMGGFFQVHWAVPSYPADDVPPGSALGFELLRGAKGARYVRAFYRAQTMDQLRNLTPLTGRAAPYRQYLAIPGCGNSTAATACTLDAFKRLVEKRAL